MRQLSSNINIKLRNSLFAKAAFEQSILYTKRSDKVNELNVQIATKFVEFSAQIVPLLIKLQSISAIIEELAC